MRTVDSIAPQVDKVRIYYTGCPCDFSWLEKYPNASVTKGTDKGSNAKFHFIQDDEYYFTCDDDLIYPPDYVSRTLAALKKHGGYVTYHGRKLRGLGRNYYNGHRFFSCLGSVEVDEVIDVPGTGVGCFNTNDFKPDAPARVEWRNMDDIGIGYECARQDVKVTVLAHEKGWLKEVPVKQTTSIWREEHRNPIRQNALADQIWYFKNTPPKVSVIIPYKVDRGWLDEAIDSVERQDYAGEIELILSKSDKSASYNFNRGVENATGKYIRFLCDDDLLPPNSIRSSFEAIGNGLACHGGAKNFWANGREDFHKAAPVTFQSLMNRNSIHGGTLFFHRKVFEKYGLLDETLTTGEEFEYNLRLLQAGVKYHVCDEVVYLYRRHGAQKSLGRDADIKARAREIQMMKSRYR